MLLSRFQSAVGQAGEFGNGDTVAFAGGAGFDVVEEDDILSLLKRGEVHIDCGCMGFRQFGQLEIVGGKRLKDLFFAANVRQWLGQGRGRQKVEVPRPTSSIRTRDCSVAWWRM